MVCRGGSFAASMATRRLTRELQDLESNPLEWAQVGRASCAHPDWSFQTRAVLVELTVRSSAAVASRGGARAALIGRGGPPHFPSYHRTVFKLEFEKWHPAIAEHEPRSTQCSRACILSSCVSCARGRVLSTPHGVTGAVSFRGATVISVRAEGRLKHLRVGSDDVGTRWVAVRGRVVHCRGASQMREHKCARSERVG